jgi:ABC-type polysaccharide/polyol phosphate export permease
MYQFITFARTCIIYGTAPAPEAFLGCVLTAVVVLMLGIGVFKKHQNKFVLYV